MKGLTAARLSPDGRIKDVRADHVARYRWAAERIDVQQRAPVVRDPRGGHVIDAGCNCGYGAAILADSGLTVTAMDNWARGLEYACKHWNRDSIVWASADFEADFMFPPADAVVAFEVIEHLADPRPLLIEALRVAEHLFASVPNQDVWPHTQRLYPVHQRHYTREQFSALLMGCGWSRINWFGQDGSESPVEQDKRGRTLVVECR